MVNKKFFFIVSLFFLNFPLFSQNKLTIGYFDLKISKVPKSYNYLSSSLPRSLRTVLRKSGFKSVDSRGVRIKEIYDRNEIVNVGRRIRAELVICGSYNVLREKNEIQFYILLYDVKAQELVLQRRLIGKTGTGMFDMIDKAAFYLKTKIVSYLNNRKRVLALARKKREALKRLSKAEQKKLLKKQTENSTVKIGKQGIKEEPVKEPAAAKKSKKIKYTGKGYYLGLWIAYNTELKHKSDGAVDYFSKGFGDGFGPYGLTFDNYLLPWLGGGWNMSLWSINDELHNSVSTTENVEKMFLRNDVYAIIKTGKRGGFFIKLGISVNLLVSSKDTEYSEFKVLVLGLYSSIGYIFSLGKFKINLFFDYVYFSNLFDGDDEYSTHRLQLGVSLGYATF